MERDGKRWTSGWEMSPAQSNNMATKDHVPRDLFTQENLLWTLLKAGLCCNNSRNQKQKKTAFVFRESNVHLLEIKESA